MSVKKKFLKTKPVCKVTLRLTKEQARSAETVHIAGDFNDWNPDVTPMKSLKNGGFTATIDLETGKEYQFRYLINNSDWENDWDADKYIPSAYGNCENSVIMV